MEVIRGLKTLNEISSEFEVHPNQISKCSEGVSLREKAIIDSSAQDIQKPTE